MRKFKLNIDESPLQFNGFFNSENKPVFELTLPRPNILNDYSLNGQHYEDFGNRLNFIKYNLDIINIKETITSSGISYEITTTRTTLEDYMDNNVSRIEVHS